MRIWQSRLSTERLNKVVEKSRGLAKDRVDLDLIECTDLHDKFVLIRKSLGISKSEAERTLEPINRVRNSIAHSSSFASSWAEVEAFVKTLQSARSWIERLDGHIADNS